MKIWILLITTVWLHHKGEILPKIEPSYMDAPGKVAEPLCSTHYCVGTWSTHRIYTSERECREEGKERAAEKFPFEDRANTYACLAIEVKASDILSGIFGKSK